MRKISTKRAKQARKTQRQYDEQTRQIKGFKDEGYSVTEISNLTGLTESSVRSILLRAIA